MTSVFLVSPDFFRASLKKKVVDGELLAVAAALKDAGFPVSIFDAYRSKESPWTTLLDQLNLVHSPILFVHLWKVEALEGEANRVISEISAIRRTIPNLRVVGFGYLARALKTQLPSSGGFDAIVDADGSEVFSSDEQSSDFKRATQVLSLSLAGKQTSNLAVMAEHLATTTGKDDVVSIHASRGCRARCTFCTYNADLSKGWMPRSINSIADDIETVLQNSPASKIAFYDNDFGGSLDELEYRTSQLESILRARNLLGRATFSMNVRSDCLSERSLFSMRAIGVRTILVGLESFNEDTRLKRFGKILDITHLRRMVALCDNLDIEILLSYILWHPWQNPEGLKEEVKLIQEIGRHRIPQLLTRSILRVVPGTPVAHLLGFEKIQASQAASFMFKVPETERLYSRMNQWLEDRLKNINNAGLLHGPERFETLATLKLDELDYYQQTLLETL